MNCKRRFVLFLSLSVLMANAFQASAQSETIDEFIKAEMQKQRIPGLAGDNRAIYSDRLSILSNIESASANEEFK